MSDQQDSPNHILNCSNCGTVKVIPKDAPFEYEDDFCQTCGKSFFGAPEPEEPEPEAMSDPMREEKDKPDVEKLFELWQAAQDYKEALLERNQLIRECLERGIAVSRISESAGISKAAIYRYKED